MLTKQAKLYYFVASTGRFCECNLNEAEGEDSTNSQKCIKQGGSGDLCEGHGTCECGKCKCNRDYAGKYCDYEKTEYCEGSDGKICSGEFLQP